MIFRRVGDLRPYPEHGLTPREWTRVPPRQLRLDQLVTTRRTLDLEALLAEDSTFYGDLFAHVVEWEGTLYLEDGLHRAVRAALAQRTVIHARVLVLPLVTEVDLTDTPAAEGRAPSSVSAGRRGVPGGASPSR